MMKESKLQTPETGTSNVQQPACIDAHQDRGIPLNWTPLTMKTKKMQSLPHQMEPRWRTIKRMQQQYCLAENGFRETTQCAQETAPVIPGVQHTGVSR